MYILDLTLEVCSGNAVKVWKFIGEILTIIKIAVPIILIIMGSIDLMKAVMANKDDEIKKNQMLFVKRLIAGIIVFIVPTIVSVILTLLGEENRDSCLNCVLNTSTCAITNND